MSTNQKKLTEWERRVLRCLSKIQDEAQKTENKQIIDWTDTMLKGSLESIKIANIKHK